MALNALKLKNYLRVDHAADDDLIRSMLLAATTYIKNTTGKTLKESVAIEEDALFQTCVKMLVAHWYENRGVEMYGALTKISHSVDAIISHIAVCGEYT